MAWRNLWRRKRRTFITGSTVALGVFLSVTFTASGDYMYTNTINTAAKMGFGHVTVQPAGYNDSPSLKKRVKNAAEIRDKIMAAPGVTDAVTRIVGSAMYASASKSVGGMFIGVDPDQEVSGSNVFIESIVEGDMFDLTTGKSVVIGKKMAEKMNLKIGKKLVWTTTDAEGEIVSELARVVAIFHTGVAEVDSAFVILPIDRVRKTLGYDEGDATLISIMVHDQRYTGKMADSIEAIVGDKTREVVTWRTTQADMAGLITVDRASNYMFQFLIGLMIAAGILNTILMSVLERRHEFGIMLAVGMAPFRLFVMVLVESIFLGLVGLVIGIIVTSPWFYYVATTGIDLSSMIEEGYDIGGVMVDPVMKFRLYKESAAWILTGVFSLTVLAGLYPAIKAGRIPPIESIRGE